MASCRSEGSLRNNLVSLFLRLLMASAVLPLAGCIAHAPGNGGGGQNLGRGNVIPILASLSTCEHADNAQHRAIHRDGDRHRKSGGYLELGRGSRTRALVCTATGSALGTITSTGTSTMTYTAPQGPLPISPCGVAVTATSNEDNSTTGQAFVNVHVIVTVTSASATNTIGQGAIYSCRRRSRALRARIRAWTGA